MKQVTAAEMKKELELMPTGFEDEPTVVDGSYEAELIAAPEPPALPFTLTREKASNDEAWLSTLSPEKRAILEQATQPARDWPFASRLPGAVAQPARKIPSL
jgi:hypothetical protein